MLGAVAEMETITIATLMVLAFACEYVDSSLGMGYGTILSPLLIIAGIDPLLVIPSILISQAMAGLSAALFHHRYENVDLRTSRRDLNIALLIIGVGVSATVCGVFVALNIPISALKTYIGVLVLVMGVIILTGKTFRFSWKRLIGIGALSAFNKSMSGGGFGPVVTCGQIVSGVEVKRSIAITTFTEAPICIVSFLFYMVLGGGIEPLLPIVLTIGAMLATPIGPKGTSIMNTKRALKAVGILTITLGLFTLLKTYVL